MELKQIKRIKNLHGYNTGDDAFQINPLQYSGAGISATQSFQPKLSSTNIGQMITNPSINPLSPPVSNSPIEINGITDVSPNGDIRRGSTVQAEVKPNAGQKVASIVGGVVDIAGGVIGTQNAVRSSGEMMANAGTSLGNIGGVGYDRQNFIDEDAEKSVLNGTGLSNTLGGVAKGASAGAAFGPIGAGIGAVVGGIANLFSWGSAKRKLQKRLENARQLTARLNTGAQAGAMTDSMQQNYYAKYGNTTQGVLYANKGKDLRLC